jgi:hypothetical protein
VGCRFDAGLRLFRHLNGDGSARRTEMSSKMGRMTKRNRTKYRRRAYEAGMLRKASVSPTVPSRLDRSTDGAPRDHDGKRAA